MEPVSITEPNDNFLKKVKDLTHKNGSIFIFDEIVTGFRFAIGGAQEYFKVTADLVCFGKAMANGFPISAIAGKKEIMKMFEDVFYSFTSGGEIVSIAAALATIKELKDKDVIPYIWKQGERIKQTYNNFAGEYGLDQYTQCIGFPPRLSIFFKDREGKEGLMLKSLFQQECIKRGILFAGGHVVCFKHSNSDINYTLKVYRTALGILKEAIARNRVKDYLEGKPLTPVFRRV